MNCWKVEWFVDVWERRVETGDTFDWRFQIEETTLLEIIEINVIQPFLMIFSVFYNVLGAQKMVEKVGTTLIVSRLILIYQLFPPRGNVIIFTSWRAFGAVLWIIRIFLTFQFPEYRTQNSWSLFGVL